MSTLPDISVALPPTPQTPDLVAYAEELGYTRAWLYDTPALQLDVWMSLALCAARTDRIGLGPAVLVPNLRHVLVTASAIAHLESLAAGRTAYAIGTGFTARMALGQRPLPWQYVIDYVSQLKALLRGETVEVDGTMIAMIHGDGQAPPRPLTPPIIIAATGPKGQQLAREHGDGVFGVGPVPGFDFAASLTFGTVLDPGESADSERVLGAAGPAAAVAFHAIYESNPAAVESLPGGAVWKAAIESFPENVRHLEIHRGHLTSLNDHDRQVVTGPMAVGFTMSGEAADVRARLEQLGSAGVTDVAYQPIGPDPQRELRAFIEAARG